jgi:8-oxo-dGTP pyrophosphatase MutT (NUDIX family)
MSLTLIDSKGNAADFATSRGAREMESHAGPALATLLDVGQADKTLAERVVAECGRTPGQEYIAEAMQRMEPPIILTDGAGHAHEGWDDAANAESDDDTGYTGHVAVFRKGGAEVLLVWSEDSLRWEMPGGHVKADERQPDGAVREVQEETGVAIPARGVLIAVSEAPHAVYATEVSWDGPLVPERKGFKPQWVRTDALPFEFNWSHSIELAAQKLYGDAVTVKVAEPAGANESRMVEATFSRPLRPGAKVRRLQWKNKVLAANLRKRQARADSHQSPAE